MIGLTNVRLLSLLFIAKVSIAKQKFSGGSRSTVSMFVWPRCPHPLADTTSEHHLVCSRMVVTDRDQYVIEISWSRLRGGGGGLLLNMWTLRRA